MSLDHEAIYLAYKDQVVSIDDTAGCFDKDNKKVDIDNAKVKEARATIDAQEAATLYQRQRTGEAGTTDTIYLPLPLQLDMQYWDSVNGTTTWKDHITAVKSKYPKP